MAKRNISRPKWLTEDVQYFFTAILKLRSKDECKQFFRDLLSVPELKTFAMRWKVANMLYDGITYQDIEKATGMSSTTIARISRWLEYGEGGYKLLIKRTRRRS
ncbi:MAG: YerC/YecD family TrpR-related protein [Candidatus Dojkabacteria bacterium]|nr:YerC/YecD family TrpR-related protein [Candidatus Dojkabacteria bacterium]